MAIRLAHNGAAMNALKLKLAKNRLSCPLFDTDRFRRNIEAAYTAMVEARNKGEPPRSFAVDTF
jgi:predicted O-linked N-acetylglucosamine transferase (SPINDLY family)